MFRKRTRLKLIKRLILWVLYFYSGFVLYSNNGVLYSFLITFSRIVYPLSIFWLQIRLKRRNHFLNIDSSMSTSQLWFNLLPIIASISTVILSLTNAFLYILGMFINT